MMVHDDLAWKETEEGRWERDIDEAEQFYTTLARKFGGTGRTFFAMTAHVSFSVPLEGRRSFNQVVTALRSAWLQLRYDHPTIASWVEYDTKSNRCKKVYNALPHGDNLHRKAWVDDTFQIVSSGQTGKEWCNSDPPIPKLPTLFLLRRPISNDNYEADIVLRSQHNIIDGIGSLHLLNNLFKYASLFLENPAAALVEFCCEWKNLNPPMRVAASIPNSLEPEQRVRLRKIYKRNSSLREGEEYAMVPQRHQRVELTLNLEESSQILKAAKSSGASLTHVYHAAIAIVMRDLQERHRDERIVRYISYSLINERPLCQEPFNSPQQAASVYHSVLGLSLAIDLDVPSWKGEQTPITSAARKNEFVDVLGQVKKYHLTIRDDKEHILLAPSYWAHATPDYPTGATMPPVPVPSEEPSISISSLGVLDKIISSRHGAFNLESPWVTGEELGTGLGLFLGTFRGRLCLSAAYNDAWYDESGVMKILRDCNELVVHGLGL
ncbi:hypothetical protein N7491_005251 [Penicillium cf. griseofulvum]|uniref:Uncharacterized protein n=1 Tax=Penicillium cf. griseofulvum TaxID=2972120 RepID=A0A9W9J358_9EURO|nr:hypothetical protein N7472_007943 [Penicillium cf. griseofulvum]KAJ5434656.1 hypothetical protein N7491_005251 [Penicillium cf. griseofulvum]KAJ5452485.1 hypothetical protein N7445_000668 [Penicillium cf. griseofulvum]